MARSSFGKAAFSGSRTLWAKGIRFFGGGEKPFRLLSSVSRVSSDIINKDFINGEAVAAGWKPPYPNNVNLRKIATAQELKFYRVHVDPDRAAENF